MSQSNGEARTPPPEPQVLIAVHGNKLHVFVTPTVDALRLRGMLEVALEQIQRGEVDGAIPQVLINWPEERQLVTGSAADVAAELKRQEMTKEMLKVG